MHEEYERYLEIIRLIKEEQPPGFDQTKQFFLVHVPVVGTIRDPTMGMAAQRAPLCRATLEDIEFLRWKTTRRLDLKSTHYYFFRQEEHNVDAVEVMIIDHELKERCDACYATVCALLALNKKCGQSSVQRHVNTLIAQMLWATRWDVQWNWWYDADDSDYNHEPPPWGNPRKKQKRHPLEALYKPGVRGCINKSCDLY
jgi:hypothetical protein